MVLWWPVSETDWFPSSGNKSDRASIKRSLLCPLQSNKWASKIKFGGLLIPSYSSNEWASITFGSPCMSSLFSKQRLAAFKKQSGRCYYCGSFMWLKNCSKFAIEHNISESEAARFQCTAEHLLARCDGGNNSSENIVAACRFCNGTRHKRKTPLVPQKYRSYIHKRLQLGKWHPHKLHHLLCSPQCL